MKSCLISIGYYSELTYNYVISPAQGFNLDSTSDSPSYLPLHYQDVLCIKNDTSRTVRDKQYHYGPVFYSNLYSLYFSFTNFILYCAMLKVDDYQMSSLSDSYSPRSMTPSPKPILPQPYDMYLCLYDVNVDIVDMSRGMYICSSCKRGGGVG